MGSRAPRVVFLLALLAGAGSFGLAYAQGDESVRVQPAFFEDRAEAGEVIRQILQVTNLGTDEKTYYLLARNIADVGAAGQPVFSDDDVPWGVAGWITLERSSLTLRGGETGEVPFTIQVPGNPSPGGHFGGVFLSLLPPKPGEAETGAGSGIGYQVGSIVSLRIGGEIIEEARIREFRTEKNVYDAPPVGFTVKVENPGNVLVRPRGPLTITDIFGRDAGTLIANPGAAAVFPGGARDFSVTWDPEGPAIGRYQAVLALAYGEDSRRTASASLSFWVLPLRLLIGGLIGLLLLSGALYGALQWYVRRRIRALGAATGGGTSATPPVLSSARLLFFTLGLVLFVLILLFAIFVLFG